MKNNIKFSIISPNYNKGEYIDEYINSILNQTYKNYEIIFIDDASTDNSLDIIKKYDIPVLHTNHLQAGGARNVGLKYASGDYIIFLDSDDYLATPTVLEELANLINDEDLIFLNYTKNNFGDISLIEEKYPTLEGAIEFTTNLGVPTKCFKRTLISDLSFPEGKRFEDMIFTLEAMCKAKKAVHFTKPFFVYRKVANSNSSANIELDTMLDILEELIKMYRLCDKYPQYKLNLLNRIKRDKLDTRLSIMNELIEFNRNTFYEHF